MGFLPLSETLRGIRPTERRLHMRLRRGMLQTKGRGKMDHYVTGGVIRALREKKKLTQSALADRIGVSDKAVSKWETGGSLR